MELKFLNLEEAKSAEFIFEDNNETKLESFVKNIKKDDLDYFYIIVNNGIKFSEYVKTNKLNFCNILVESSKEKSKYFCSYKYFLLNNKLYKYDKYLPKCSDKNSYILYADNYIIKYTGKGGGFLEDSKKELKLIDKLYDKYDFIRLQEILEKEINDNYAISIKRKINGKVLDKNMLNKLTVEQKIKILKQLAEQLYLLELNEYIYNDLHANNFMIDDDYNCILIDLGSVFDVEEKYNNYKKLTRNNSFNVAETFLVIIYELFNNNDEFYCGTVYDSNIRNKIYDANNYEIDIRRLVLDFKNIYDKYDKNIFEQINNLMKIISVKNNKIYYNNKYLSYKKVIKEKINKKGKRMESSKYYQVLEEYFAGKISSILDLQCDIHEEIKKVGLLNDNNVNYIGININDKIISENRIKFKNDKNKIFMVLDPINDPLPKADLIISGNFIKKLNNNEIWSLLGNIRESQAKYFVFPYSHAGLDEINKNSKSINLSFEPFVLPAPECLLPTKNLDESLAVYNIEKVSFFMSWVDEKTLNLRKEIVKYFDKDLEIIFEVFKKQENGKKLFIDAFKNDIDYDKYYYNEPYKSIVDKNNIFTKYINLMIVKKNSKDEIERLRKESTYGFLINGENFYYAKTIFVDYFCFKYRNLIKEL